MSAGFNVRGALLPPKHLGCPGPEQLVAQGPASLWPYRITTRPAGGRGAGAPRLPLQEALAFPRVGAGNPAKSTLLPSAQMEQKQGGRRPREEEDAPTTLPTIPSFCVFLLGQAHRVVSAPHPAPGPILKAAWTKPWEMYLFVSLSMNRLVKSFTWATRSPKGFTLRATLSEVSRTKNRSTGQSGKKQRGRSRQAALLHLLPSPGSPHHQQARLQPNFPPSRLPGSVLSHPNPTRDMQAHTRG